jgi:hypothetical protein
VDPLQFFGASGQPPPVPAPRTLRPPRAAPLRTPAPRPKLVPTVVARRVGAPVPVAARRVGAPIVRPVGERPTERLAPWPAWAGLSLLLAGACGAGLARHRRAPRPQPGAAMTRVARE